MQVAPNPEKHWHALLSELRDVQQREDQEWGEVDEFLIARYLAGECDEKERAVIERARQTIPQLRECIAVCHEALNEFCTSETPPVEDTEKVRPLESARESPGWRISRLASSGAILKWAAAACLLVTVRIGWVAVTRLNNLSTQVAALEGSRQNAGGNLSDTAMSAELQSLRSGVQTLKGRVDKLGHRPAPETLAVAEASGAQDALLHEERVATALRGYREEPMLAVPVTTYYAPSVPDAGVNLPHDPSDNPPTLPPEQLLPVLNHRTELVRWAAADALSRITAGEMKTKARAQIIEALRKRDDLGRAAADYVLSGRIADGFGADLSEAATDGLASHDRIVRWAGLHYFLVVRRSFADAGAPVASPTFFDPQALSRLMGQFAEIARQDQDPLLRKAAVYLLGQFGNEAKPWLEDLMQIVESDGDPQARRWAAYAIGQIGVEAKEVAPRLGRILVTRASNRDHEQDELVFPAVAYAFGELCRGDRQADQVKEVAPVLLECLDDTDPNISYWSAWALWRINEYGSVLAPSTTNLIPVPPKPTPTYDRPSVNED
jgi:HEAT repeat protein